MLEPADEPLSISIVDPDALGGVMTQVAVLARDLRTHGIGSTIGIRITITVPAEEQQG